MKKIDINKSFFCLGFTALYVRIKNCLLAADIYTIRELCRYQSKDLQKFPQMGATSIYSIEKTLGEYGLKLGMTEEELDDYTRTVRHVETENTANSESSERRYHAALELIAHRGLSVQEAVSMADNLLAALQNTPEETLIIG